MDNYWDKVAVNKGYYFGDYDNPARKLMLELVNDGESFLDIGCGNGMTYDLFIKNKRKIFYYGIDYSKKFIKNCLEKFPGATCFQEFSAENLDSYPSEADAYDTVYFRHVFENIRDWKKAFGAAYKLAKKRVIIDTRRSLVDGESRLLEDRDDTVCWDINRDEFNHLARTLSVNVSYLKRDIGDSNEFIVIGKKMDDVVFTLDDFHKDNHNIGLLASLKGKYPGLKVTLFTIPSKSPTEWLASLKKEYGEWMEFAVHGWLHDINGYPNECSMWSKEDALKYLSMADETGQYVKLFKAPGWQMSQGTYEALEEKGYWIMDHEQYKHLRPDGFKNYYETGHLWEVNGHIQDTPYNGLDNIINNKINFRPDTRFHFASEMAGSEMDKQRLCHLADRILTQES